MDVLDIHLSRVVQIAWREAVDIQHVLSVVSPLNPLRISAA